MTIFGCSAPPQALGEDGAATTVPPSFDGGRRDAGTPDAGARDGGPLRDFALGPYPSAHALFLAGLFREDRLTCLPPDPNDAGRYDRYTGVAAMGYVLQAASTYLSTVQDNQLPGGEDERRAVLDAGLTLAAGLTGCDGFVVDGGLGWGLDTPWDAFQDHSTNPAFTAYAWQTGMAVLGIAELAAYLRRDASRFPELQSQALQLIALAEAILDRWHGAGFSAVPQHPEWTFCWYSLDPNDARAVYNTTSLLSRAETIIADAVGDPSYGVRAFSNFAYLSDAGLHYAAASDSYFWHYSDFGYPWTPRAEDASHASHTESWMRFALDRGLFSAVQASRVQHTLLDVMYAAGNPGRLTAYVDGTSDPLYDWQYTPPAAIGISTWGDALAASAGGKVELWELGKNVFLSSDLQANDVSESAPLIGAYDTTLLANLFAHRPPELAPDSRWAVSAGDPCDLCTPFGGDGGVRFYPPDWSAAAPFSDPALPNQAGFQTRTATAAYANFAVDLPGGTTGDVLVSVTYRSATAGLIQQYDGTRYLTVAPLPATAVPGRSVPVFFRVSFRLNHTNGYDDHQPTVPGINVLMQLTPNGVEVEKLEATPL